jgi:hypothetical protein
MQFRRLRFSVKGMMSVVAFAGLLMGGERMWRRSDFYRKQAALCAYFELQMRWYSTHETEEFVTGRTIEELREDAENDRRMAKTYSLLKVSFGRVARRPWESLPPDTPNSVNPWDLGRLTASEIEQMVKEFDDE